RLGVLGAPRIQHVAEAEAAALARIREEQLARRRRPDIRRARRTNAQPADRAPDERRPPRVAFALALEVVAVVLLEETRRIRPSARGFVVRPAARAVDAHGPRADAVADERQLEFRE